MFAQIKKSGASPASATARGPRQNSPARFSLRIFLIDAGVLKVYVMALVAVQTLDPQCQLLNRVIAEL